MKIGILSDTHGVIPDKFIQELSSCDYVIHAGDIGNAGCFEQLKTVSKHLYMVRGNCDMGDWARYIPETLAFRIDGITFYLIHNRRNLPYDYPESDYVIFGHTHTLCNERHRDTTFLNPGSAGMCRGDQVSMMVMETSGGKASVRTVYL